MKRATFNQILDSEYHQNFNPRPREEGDPKTSFKFSASADFNPRPREEGDIHFLLKTRQILYFNPRPREEGDLFTLPVSMPYIDISIHALVKRATVVV